MTKYSYLLNKKQSGELSILFERGLPVHLVTYMEICAFHLAHRHYHRHPCLPVGWRKQEKSLSRAIFFGKYTENRKKNAKIFAYVVKKQYLCTRF